MRWKEFMPGYHVSDSGLIKKLKLKRKNKEQIKTGTKRTYEAKYLTLMLNKRWYYVHKIVAQVFVRNPNPSLYTEILHINGNTQDNRASNLKWVHVSSIPKQRAYGQHIKPESAKNKYRIRYKYEILLSGSGKSLGVYDSIDHARDMLKRLENTRNNAQQ